ncbi:putative metal dependent phosphohydrolase [Mycobacterium xenopi 4042]|uniref:Putative metal dependent phosphohydrolase n=1 Tax=Mycobacterium xenopi 4042 TaxID=1299334 RepID=X8BG68_MYCXE|nr:putative metal dependent phosphohydrolase [Mycobacterium xenopi 4042]
MCGCGGGSAAAWSAFRRRDCRLFGGGGVAARYRLRAVGAPDGFHPLDGAEFVRSAGFGKLVASLVAFHTGAHVEASERGLQGLSEFGDPPSDVLDALTFCDLTTGRTGRRCQPMID